MNKYGMIIEEKRVHFAIIEAENEDAAMERAAELDISDYVQSDIDGNWQVEYIKEFEFKTPDNLITKKIIG